MRRILALSTAIFFSAGTAHAEDQPRIAAIDAVAEQSVGDETPGLAVLVMKHGEVVHMAGYGVTDIETEEPVTEDTIFDMASVSKEMTALAAALQIEDKLYNQGTEIATFLPAFADQPGEERALTIGDLLHHTGGMVDYLNADETLDYGEETTNAEVVDWLAKQELDHPPGTRFDYSNSGYVTLGTLVAKADAADSLSDVLHVRIWDRLGMERTGLVDVAESVKPDEVATGYKGTKGNFEISHERTVTEGDGNVMTCLTDLALYEAALANNELLSARATDMLFKNGRYDDGSPIADEDGAGYGFGWSVDTINQDRYAYHSGSWMGTATYYQRNLTSGVTVIVLANGEDAAVGGIAEAVEEAYDGD